jgi:hypothetical protein
MLLLRASLRFSSSRFLWLELVLFAASSVLAVAQSGPKYDASTEAKFKGTIEELKLPPSGKEKEIAHLLIKDADETLDFYLCPKSFMDDMGVSFTKGEELVITGSKVKQGDTEMVLTRQVVRGTETLVLRDEKGNPVWVWKH